MSVLFHYTVKCHLDFILHDRLIKVATANVQPGVRPAVWFSSNPEWEETANKSIRLPDGQIMFGNKQMTREAGGGLARICVMPEMAPYRWNDYKRMSGDKRAVLVELYQHAISVGARPGEWYCSFDAVPSDKWVSVELYDGEKWTPFEWQTALLTGCRDTCEVSF